jgi:hypothetical protein
MGFLDRFRRTPPPPRPPRDAPAEDPRGDLAGAIRRILAPGFVTRAEVGRIAEEIAEADHPGLTARDVAAVVGSVWAEVAAEQAGWADEGDYTRLQAAFTELGSDGITARMNFTCCNTCGNDEIGDERAEGDWGYTFFHQQDAERLEPGGSELYLGFGSFGPGRGLDPDLLRRAQDGDHDARLAVVAQSDAPVAARVVTALERHGLRTEWNGSTGQKIRVRDLDWRKKLPTG